MNRQRWLVAMPVLWAAAFCAVVVAADLRPQSEFAGKATWQLPGVAEVREQALGWLTTRPLDAATRAQMELLWASAGDEHGDAHLFDLVVATLAAGDPRASQLVTVCSQPRHPSALPAIDWLSEPETADFERNNLRLLYGRWLVQASLIDEALEVLGELKTDQVVDPATLLFYQAVVHHGTLNRDVGLATVARLLENEAALPKRYVSVAQLMQADLEGLKDESLDHIARRMDDIRRRLDLGRAGPKVRTVEDGVIASLDKLIDQVEKQQQAAAAAAAKSGRGTSRPSNPMPDSRPAELKGPGEVANKPIGDTSGWGDLPPRQRQEALQQIGKDFPAHYRDVIEQYFRKLATDEDAKGEK